MDEHFIVRHYTKEEGPVFKGNGFDGTRVGEDREEAEQLAAWINQRLDEAQRYYQALQGAVADQAEDRKRIRELEAWRFNVCERLGMSCAAGAEWTDLQVFEHVQWMLMRQSQSETASKREPRRKVDGRYVNCSICGCTCTEVFQGHHDEDCPAFE